jgi:hypothetical protein
MDWNTSSMSCPENGCTAAAKYTVISIPNTERAKWHILAHTTTTVVYAELHEEEE